MSLTHSESVADLATALAKAQAQMRGAVKDSTNPHFSSRFASLASVWDACREALTSQGLSVIQGASGAQRTVTVSTMLLHQSGQWIRDELTMTAVKDDPQGLGSALTYARRYALAAMVGISPEDDDANAASAVKQKALDAATAKPPRGTKAARPAVPDGIVFVNKVVPRSKGSYEWAEVVLSTGEEVIADQRMLGALMAAAQENTPIEAVCSINAKGRTILDEFRRWPPTVPDDVPSIQLESESF